MALELTRQLYVDFWVAAEKPTADLSPAPALAAPAADPDDLFAPAVVAAVGAPITIEQWEGGRRVALRAKSTSSLLRTPRGCVPSCGVCMVANTVARISLLPMRMSTCSITSCMSTSCR